MKCPICSNSLSSILDNEFMELLNCNNCKIVYINHKLQSSYCYKNYIIPATITKPNELQEEQIKKINFALDTSFNPITFIQAEQIIEENQQKAQKMLIKRNTTEPVTIKQKNYIKQISHNLLIYVNYDNLSLGNAKEFISYYKEYNKYNNYNSFYYDKKRIDILVNLHYVRYCILFDSKYTAKEKTFYLLKG